MLRENIGDLQQSQCQGETLPSSLVLAFHLVLGKFHICSNAQFFRVIGKEGEGERAREGKGKGKGREREVVKVGKRGDNNILS